MLAALRANIAATIFGLLAALFAIIAMVQSVKLNGFLWIDGVTDKLEKCEAARVADRLVYEQAQRDAKAKNEAEVRATEQQYKDANDEAKRNLTARLERLRRELLKGAAPVKGAAGQPDSPETPGGPGTPQAAGLCLTPEEHVLGAENEERHDQLISLVEKLLQITAQPAPPH